MIEDDFGKRVIALRTQLGLTQDEFEKQCDMTRGHITRIEQGQRTPNLDTIKKIADGTGLTLTELFKGLPAVPISEDPEINRIAAYAKGLNDENKQNIIKIMKMFLDNQKKNETEE